MSISIIHSILIIVVLVNPHYAFIHLTYLALTSLKLIYFTVYHYEFIFHISTLNMRFQFLIAHISVRQSPLHSVFLPIFLEINETILHNMKLMQFLLVVTTVSLLLLYEFSTLQEMILYPVLSTVKDEWINHHYEEKF